MHRQVQRPEVRGQAGEEEGGEPARPLEGEQRHRDQAQPRVQAVHVVDLLQRFREEKLILPVKHGVGEKMFYMGPTISKQRALYRIRPYTALQWVGIPE